MHLAFQFIKHCCDFVKSTFLSRASRVLDGEPKDHKRNKDREVYYSQALEEVYPLLCGTTQEDQGRVQTERLRNWGTCLH